MESSEKIVQIGDEEGGKDLLSCGVEVSSIMELKTDKTNICDGKAKDTASTIMELETPCNNSAETNKIPVDVHKRLGHESSDSPSCNVGLGTDKLVEKTNINIQTTIDPKPIRSTLKRDIQSIIDPLEGSSHHYIGNTSVNDGHEDITPSNKRRKVDIYAPDIGPQMYSVPATFATEPIITNLLPKVFQYLPIHGKPSGPNLDEFFREQIKKFVGFGLNDEDFEELEKACSPEQLKTGKELVMRTKVPVLGLLKSNVMPTDKSNDLNQPEESPNLCILKKHKFRGEIEVKNVLKQKFKYRGLRLLPPLFEETPDKNSIASNDIELDPGKDVIYHVRIYRPFLNSSVKERSTRSRVCLFLCDVLLCGRNYLTALRDRFVCHNDFDMRVDVSNNPDQLPTTNAKDVFPSGFLFINNVFYVDTRAGCIDTSRVVREWASRKKLGDFPKRDMCDVKLEDMVLKLGYPEVYVHQGDCEHVFVFSQFRLLGPMDPIRLSSYPYSTAVSHNQTVYCTTCAEYCTKWIVVGCDRVPFDPAFFCDTCFRQYLYKDGKKIGDFKAYSYRGNALNYLRPR